jgi:hypothetical protein
VHRDGARRLEHRRLIRPDPETVNNSAAFQAFSG